MGSWPWSLYTFSETPTRTKLSGFVGVACSLSHCSLTVALVEVEGATVATLECLESRTSVPVTRMDGLPGDLSCWGSQHVISPLPASLCPVLRQTRRLVICISTASPCPSAQHISVLCVEAFLLDSHRKEVTLERTAVGHLDQPPAQSQAGFRITSGPFLADIFKNLQEQRLHSLFEYLSGLTCFLGKETWDCFIFWTLPWVTELNKPT